MLEVTTLGGAALTRDGEDIRAGVKQIALLAYISVVGSGSPVPRDTLFALFWPESDQARARNALNQLLHQLRRLVGQDLIQSRPDGSVSVLPEALIVDALEFQKAVALGNYDEAIEYYRGPFLDGFHLPGCRAFEEWLHAKRESLRSAAQSAATELARARADRGDLMGALEPLRRAVEWDPYDEALFGTYLQALVSSGRRGEAKRAYDRFAARFREDLDAIPSESLREILRGPFEHTNLTSFEWGLTRVRDGIKGLHNYKPNAPWGILVAAALAVVLGFTQVLWRGNDAGSGSPTRITDDGSVHDAELSDDGQFVAYTRGPWSSGPTEIIVKQIGKDPVHSLFNAPGIGHLDWVNGGEIIFNAHPPSDSFASTFQVPILGGTARRLGRSENFTVGTESLVRYRYNSTRLYIDNDTLTIPMDSIWVMGLDQSPDGGRIAIVVEKLGTYALLIISTDPRSQRLVVPVVHDAPLGKPEWEPDGSGIYLPRARQSSWDLIKVARLDDTRQDASTFEPLLTELELMTAPGRPASVSINKDATRLAFVRHVASQNLFVVDLRKRDSVAGARRLTAGSQVYSTPRYSPDGRSIVFTRDRASGSDIYTMDLASGVMTRRTFGEWQSWYPSWSPTGDRIAYGSSNASSNVLMILDLELGRAVEVSNAQWGSEREVVWSGEETLFYNEHGDRNYRQFDLVRGTEEEFLPQEFGWVYGPRFDPARMRVATQFNVPTVLRDRYGPPGVFVFDVNTKEFERLIEGFGWHPIGWLDDATIIVIKEGSRDVFRIDVESGHRDFLVTLPFDVAYSELGLAPSGESLVAAVDESISDVFMVEGFDPKYR